MDLSKCEAALQAADSGSFTAAAAQMNYTQSGITRMIGSLEEELGFPLFIRSKSGVELTENGKAMLPLLRDLVRAGRNAEQMSADIRGSVEGVVTVGSYFSISAMLLPEILREFCSRYPKVSVKLREGGNLEMAEMLRERSVDCCFCARPAIPGIEWIPLLHDELTVWLPADHPFAGAGSFPVRQLEREQFIHTSPDHDTDQDRFIARNGLHMNTRFSTQDGYTTYNMVQAGLGISFNQRLISQKWGGSVVELPFDPPSFIELGIAVPSMRDTSPAVRRLIGCAAELLNTGKAPEDRTGSQPAE